MYPKNCYEEFATHDLCNEERGIVLDNVQISQTSKFSKCDASNQCNLVVSEVPAQAVSRSHADDVGCSVTYNLVSSPSPVKASLAIDVIWLLVRYLHDVGAQNHDKNERDF